MATSRRDATSGHLAAHPAGRAMPGGGSRGAGSGGGAARGSTAKGDAARDSAAKGRASAGRGSRGAASGRAAPGGTSSGAAGTGRAADGGAAGGGQGQDVNSQDRHSQDAGGPDLPPRDAADAADDRAGDDRAGDDRAGDDWAGEEDQAGGGGREVRPRMPPVRLAPREELAAAARVAPLLRAAADLSRWAGQDPDRVIGDVLPPAMAGAAAADLELTPSEVDAAWQVVVATGLLDDGDEDGAPGRDRWDASEVLGAWDSALAAILDAEELDGLATALYTVGAPVRIDALFEAYTAAAGSSRPASAAGRPRAGRAGQPDEAAALSRALETLADLAVVELGTEETAGGLTVALSPLGVWGVHRRLRGQGWHVPVLGSADRDGAVGLLKTLASCDAEDGETEIGTWLARRTPEQSAKELIQAASAGSPGLRGAAFAVLERIGDAATAGIRLALGDPLLRAHAAVWLHEHGQEAELRPEDRTWLLVDLGAGLLEEADPQDVVAELLPEVPARAQAEIVAGLWRVDHPAVVGLLTTLSEHHPDPAVARAARKAAFKARSPGSGSSLRSS